MSNTFPYRSLPVKSIIERKTLFAQNQFNNDIRWDRMIKKREREEQKRVSFLFTANYLMDRDERKAFVDLINN